MHHKTQHRVLIFVFGLIALGFFYLIGHLRHEVFYSHAHDTIRDTWRFLWLAPFVMIGAAIRGYRSRTHPARPWVTHLKYCAYISLTATLLFISFHSFLNTENWLFYPVSGLFILYMGIIPEKGLEYIRNLINPDKQAGGMLSPLLLAAQRLEQVGSSRPSSVTFGASDFVTITR